MLRQGLIFVELHYPICPVLLQSLLLAGNPQKQVRTSLLSSGTAAVLRWLRDRMQDAHAQELIAARSRTQLMWSQPSTDLPHQHASIDGESIW